MSKGGPVRVDIQELITEYSDMVYRLAYAYAGNSFDADEIYQEVFFRLIRKKPDFKGREHAKAWLLRVTINCAKDALAGRMQHADLEEVQVAEPPKGPDREELIDLRKALEELKPEYREPICLYHLDGLSVREIAAILEKPENTVKSLLARGREILRKKLEAADAAIP